MRTTETRTDARVAYSFITVQINYYRNKKKLKVLGLNFIDTTLQSLTYLHFISMKLTYFITGLNLAYEH